MKQKEITIQGKQYPVVVNLQTIMNFEDVANISIFEANFSIIKNRIALIFSAVLSADENTTLTVGDINGNGDLEAIKVINAAYIVLYELATEFFHIPEIEKEKVDQTNEEEDEGDQPKN